MVRNVHISRAKLIDKLFLYVITIIFLKILYLVEYMNKNEIILKTTVNSELFKNLKNLQICITGELVNEQVNNYDFIDVNNDDISFMEGIDNKSIIEEKRLEIENLNKCIINEQHKYESVLKEHNLLINEYEEYKKSKDIELKKQKEEINTLNIDKKQLETDFYKCRSDSIALKKQYENKLKNLNECIALLTDELDGIFKNVRNIYDKIINLDSIYINELVKPINLHDFETFLISSVSSGDALRKIWSVAKMAIKVNDISSYEILWKYFEEMVKLHNKSKDEEIFSIDTVNIGDTYSVHDHESKDENVSFGHVSKIYILGFTNKLQGKKIEKSYVLVKG